MFSECCSTAPKSEYCKRFPEYDTELAEKEPARAAADKQPQPQAQVNYNRNAEKSEPQREAAKKVVDDAGCTVINNVENEFDKAQELSDIAESNRLCAMNTVDCYDLFMDMGLAQDKQRVCKFDPSNQ